MLEIVVHSIAFAQQKQQVSGLRKSAALVVCRAASVLVAGGCRLFASDGPVATER